MSSSTDTANAIAALLQGFRQGSQEAQNRRLQERQVENSNAWRNAQLEMLKQKSPMLSGDLFNQTFERGAGFNPGLPTEIPMQAGSTYASLLNSMRVLRQQNDDKKEKDQMLRDLRKSFRERERLLQTSLDKSREKILSAQTNLLSKPDDPEAAKTILMMQRQQEMQRYELKQLRQKAASVGLPEFSIMDNDDYETTSTSMPPTLPTLPEMYPTGASVPSTDSSSDSTLDGLMGLMGQ